MTQQRAAAWRAVGPYLDEVLELESHERAAWFADLEKRAPEIAGRVRTYVLKLEELDERNFLTGACAIVLDAPTLAGLQFGAYTLDEILGHGGMGTVWLAHRSDGRFEGRAAVKLLNTALVGHPSERRFKREGSVLAKLQHPNIAHLLDAGIAMGSQPYLVLEHVPGERIDRYCESRHLNLDERIQLFLDVLGAVAHAHSHLIVHRDVKPSNILVTENGVVKLLDFGLAAFLSVNLDNPPTQLTHHAAPGLTPGFAAPEQVRAEPVTTATDVYSLGLVLFVLLVGRHPASLDKTPAELMQLTLDADVPRASDIATDPGQRQLLRGDLDNIIAMSVRRNPAERYSTVEQFAQDLRRYLAHEPVTARPNTFLYVAAMFARRHRATAAAALAIIVVLIGAIAITAREMLNAREQRDQARFQWQRAGTSIDFLAQLMRAETSPAGPLRTFHERLDYGVELLKKQYRDDPQFAGQMMVDLADYYRFDGDMTRARDLYEQAYAVGRQSHDLQLMSSAQCSRVLGDAEANVLDGAQERVAEGQRLLAQVRDQDATLQLTCLIAQIAIEETLNHDDSAEALLRRAMSIAQERDGTTLTLRYSSFLGRLAQIYIGRSQFGEALPLIERAGRILDGIGRGYTSARLDTRQLAAIVLYDMGEARAALAERDLIDQQVRELGITPPPLSSQLFYAALLLKMRKPAEALHALEGSVERARQAGNPAVLAYLLLRSGSALTQLGRWDEAGAALHEGAAIAASQAADLNTNALAEYYTTEFELARGEIASAHRHLEKALELAGSRAQQSPPVLGRVLLMAARVALAERAQADAEQFARDALGRSEAAARGPETSADVGEALLRIAQARALSGAHADTKSLLERAVRCLTNGLGQDHPLTHEARNLLTRASA